MRRFLFLFILICLLCSGCGQTSSALKQSRTIFSMDTIMNLTIYAENDLLLDQAALLISDLEQKFSVTLKDSEIHTLNQNGSVVLSEDTSVLLSDTLALCADTKGKLDISIYPVLKTWGFTTGKYRIPSDEELSLLLKNVDYSSILLNDNTVVLPPSMQIDLGSTAKGYTGRRLKAFLKEHGVTSALLDLGGNIQTLGSKPDGSPWRIAVKDPSAPDSILGTLSLHDLAAVTSGGYERYFIGEDGNTYCHILDPFTGKPADTDLLSVTIVGQDGLLCDALSTALFIMGLNDAFLYYQQQEDFEALFVTADHKLYITEGLTSMFNLTDTSQYQDFIILQRQGNAD